MEQHSAEHAAGQDTTTYQQLCEICPPLTYTPVVTIIRLVTEYGLSIDDYRLVAQRLYNATRGKSCIISKAKLQNQSIGIVLSGTGVEGVVPTDKDIRDQLLRDLEELCFLQTADQFTFEVHDVGEVRAFFPKFTNPEIALHVCILDIPAEGRRELLLFGSRIQLTIFRDLVENGGVLTYRTLAERYETEIPTRGVLKKSHLPKIRAVLRDSNLPFTIHAVGHDTLPFGFGIVLPGNEALLQQLLQQLFIAELETEILGDPTHIVWTEMNVPGHAHLEAALYDVAPYPDLTPIYTAVFKVEQQLFILIVASVEQRDLIEATLRGNGIITYLELANIPYLRHTHIQNPINRLRAALAMQQIPLTYQTDQCGGSHSTGYVLTHDCFDDRSVIEHMLESQLKRVVWEFTDALEWEKTGIKPFIHFSFPKLDFGDHPEKPLFFVRTSEYTIAIILPSFTLYDFLRIIIENRSIIDRRHLREHNPEWTNRSFIEMKTKINNVFRENGIPLMIHQVEIEGEVYIFLAETGVTRKTATGEAIRLLERIDLGPLIDWIARRLPFGNMRAGVRFFGKAIQYRPGSDDTVMIALLDLSEFADEIPSPQKIDYQYILIRDRYSFTRNRRNRSVVPQRDIKIISMETARLLLNGNDPDQLAAAIEDIFSAHSETADIQIQATTQ